MTRLVQKRLLIDVVLADFSAVAANAQRRPDPEVRCKQAVNVSPTHTHKTQTAAAAVLWAHA
jgi:hypothetical protein